MNILSLLSLLTWLPATPMWAQQHTTLARAIKTSAAPKAPATVGGATGHPSTK